MGPRVRISELEKNHKKVLSLRHRLKKDPALAQRIRMRGVLLRSLREQFHRDGFLEVDTPSLCVAGDPSLHLESFSSQLDWRGEKTTLWMPTSPEQHMKRLVASGFGNIFQICKFYRNGELGVHHQPEFTGLEWYEIGARVEDTMSRTEKLIRQAARDLLDDEFEILNQETMTELEKPFRRVSMKEAMWEFARVDVPDDWDMEILRKNIEKAGIHTSGDDSFEDLVNRVVVHRLEPTFLKLGSPVFLTDFPAPMAAMARVNTADHTAERFELYAGGLELCNGYGELTDPREQRARFEKQIDERRSMSKTVPPVDEAFLSALEHGMPDCSGNALGVDRLLMLLTGARTIQDVTAFPIEDELGWGEESY